jgi:hypothetical protein
MRSWFPGHGDCVEQRAERLVDRLVRVVILQELADEVLGRPGHAREATEEARRHPFVREALARRVEEPAHRSSCPRLGSTSSR